MFRHQGGGEMTRRSSQTVAIVGAFVLLSILFYYSWSLTSENRTLKKLVVKTYSKLKDMTNHKSMLEKKNTLLSNRMVEMEEQRNTEKQNAETEQLERQRCTSKLDELKDDCKANSDKVKKCEDASVLRENNLLQLLKDIELDTVSSEAEKDIFTAKIKYLKDQVKTTGMDFRSLQDKYSELEKNKISLEENIAVLDRKLQSCTGGKTDKVSKEGGKKERQKITSVEKSKAKATKKPAGKFRKVTPAKKKNVSKEKDGKDDKMTTTKQTLTTNKAEKVAASQPTKEPVTHQTPTVFKAVSSFTEKDSISKTNTAVIVDKGVTEEVSESDQEKKIGNVDSTVELEDVEAKQEQKDSKSPAEEDADNDDTAISKEDAKEVSEGKLKHDAKTGEDKSHGVVTGSKGKFGVEAKKNKQTENSDVVTKNKVDQGGYSEAKEEKKDAGREPGKKTVPSSTKLSEESKGGIYERELSNGDEVEDIALNENKASKEEKKDKDNVKNGPVKESDGHVEATQDTLLNFKENGIDVIKTEEPLDINK